MAGAGWVATGDSFLGRITKARILQAVQEAKGEAAADRIAHLKKPEMVIAAEELLAATGWLPEPLRTPGMPFGAFAEAASRVEIGAEAGTAAKDGEQAMADEARPDEDERASESALSTAAE